MPAAVRADAHRQKHVAELRDRRVGQHALDVVLHQADRAGHQRRRDADDRHDRQRLRRVAEQHRVAPDHVDARRHHRRRMNQRRDRRRALPWHPAARRYSGICADLPVAPMKSSSVMTEIVPNAVSGRERRDRPRDLLKIERAEAHEDQQHAQHEPDVADAIDDERFLAGVGRRLLLIPEADQQIRTEPDALPADEHHQEVRAEHQHEHERREEIQVREIARELGVASPRACTPSSRRESACRCPRRQDHHRRERIETQREADVEIAGRDPA